MAAFLERNSFLEVELFYNLRKQLKINNIIKEKNSF